MLLRNAPKITSLLSGLAVATCLLYRFTQLSPVMPPLTFTGVDNRNDDNRKQNRVTITQFHTYTAVANIMSIAGRQEASFVREVSFNRNTASVDVLIRDAGGFCLVEDRGEHKNHCVFGSHF